MPNFLIVAQIDFCVVIVTTVTLLLVTVGAQNFASLFMVFQQFSYRVNGQPNGFVL